MNPHYHGYGELSSPHPPSPEAAFAANGHDYPHNNNNPALKECAGCGGKIVERFLLHALDRYWHHGCLKCTCCGQALADMGRSFYFKGGMILCKNDYTRDELQPYSQHSISLKFEDCVRELVNWYNGGQLVVSA